MSFEHLTPDTALSAVERAVDTRLNGLLLALPSYINRVYELETEDHSRLVAKFYRPGRWSREAVADEHRFVLDCRQAEIPVVAPLPLDKGDTLGSVDNVLFAVYPRRAGRQFEPTTDGDWRRLGSLLARIHLRGEQRPAQSRAVIDPRESTAGDIDHLCAAVIPERFREAYRTTALRLVELCAPLFDGLERMRIHGDFHRGNILDRLDEGLLVIDFDDMAMGPPVQDIWLLLPERAVNAAREIDLILAGYEQFRRFDRRSLRCIEPLRAMRMIYFLAWCSRQIDDYHFRRNFPDWGSDRFWQREIQDLREQSAWVMDTIAGGDGR
jgi:Ser/Thr protein kinase RdoA (MazF antagonist)